MCGAQKCLFRSTMRIQLFTNITKTKETHRVILPVCLFLLYSDSEYAM